MLSSTFLHVLLLLSSSLYCSSLPSLTSFRVIVSWQPEKSRVNSVRRLLQLILTKDCYFQRFVFNILRGLLLDEGCVNVTLSEIIVTWVSPRYDSHPFSPWRSISLTSYCKSPCAGTISNEQLAPCFVEE